MLTNDELMTLLEISQTINSTLDLEEILDHALRKAADVVEAEASSIWLVDDETGELYVASATGVREKEVRRLRLKPGKGIVGWVVKTGKPFVTSDARSEPVHARDIAEMLDYEGRQILCVPMFSKGKVVGAIEVINKSQDRPFTEKDAYHLSIFANLTGIAIENAKLYAMLQRENRELRSELGKNPTFGDIIYRSEKMAEVIEITKRVASVNSTVLIRGESGTGKELIARAIHQASPRRDGPFIPVNCGALPETLLESELFGHEKGAFTGAIARKLGRFELADGGTIFLDEIGDMPPALQVKLLRVLQDKQFERVGGTKTIKVDVRVIAATNQNLEKLMAEGKFREDLYYRLNVITIFIPPLRERPEDIPILAEHFLRKYCLETKKKIKGFAPETMDILMSYHWPGNVRELENAIEHAVVLAKGDIITPEDLPFNLRGVEPEIKLMSLEEAVREFKKRHITRVLHETGGNRTKAAEILKIQRTYLSRLIKELGIKA
ncbi:Fis family transcriptional regulator [Candidatus Poribacteria bacterium]|nr:MAG: Fis family transcriptional regulator [Candidatus Poribacteria bacterium]